MADQEPLGARVQFLQDEQRGGRVEHAPPVLHPHEQPVPLARVAEHAAQREDRRVGRGCRLGGWGEEGARRGARALPTAPCDLVDVGGAAARLGARARAGGRTKTGALESTRRWCAQRGARDSQIGRRERRDGRRRREPSPLEEVAEGLARGERDRKLARQRLELVHEVRRERRAQVHRAARDEALERCEPPLARRHDGGGERGEVDGEDGPAARGGRELRARDLHHRSHLLDRREAARERHAHDKLGVGQKVKVQREGGAGKQAELEVEIGAAQSEPDGAGLGQREVVGCRRLATDGDALFADRLVDGL